MAQLTFTKQEDGTYEGVETVSGPFNLHVESKSECSVVVKQRTSGTEFATTFNGGLVYPGHPIDADAEAGEVFDKDIKVVVSLSDPESDIEDVLAIITEG